MIQIPEETRVKIFEVLTPSNIFIFFIFIFFIYIFFIHNKVTSFFEKRKLKKTLDSKKQEQPVKTQPSPFFQKDLEDEFQSLIKSRTRQDRLRDLYTKIEQANNESYYECRKLAKLVEDTQKKYNEEYVKYMAYQEKLQKISEELNSPAIDKFV